MSALGILLVLVGAALVVAEAHLPSHGALGTAALVSLVAGVGLLVSAAGLGTAAIVAASLATAVFGAVFLVLVVRKALATRRLGLPGGPSGLVGHVGVVRSAPEPVGAVLVDGALWRARVWELDGERPLAPGDPVVVEHVRGLTLTVRPAEDWEVLA